MSKGVKHPSPFKLHLDPDEALERFIGTEPSEVEALIKRGREKETAGRQACTQAVRRYFSV